MVLVRAVSYTHLDVYKRQVVKLAEEVNEPVVPEHTAAT